MINRFLASLVLLATLGISAVVEAQGCAGGWVELAAKEIDLGGSTDTIELKTARGSFRLLKLVNTGAPIVLSRIKVVYASGADHVEERRVDLRTGEGTRWIGNNNVDRFVDRVVIDHVAVPASVAKARIKVCGGQSPADALKRRGSAAISSTTTEDARKAADVQAARKKQAESEQAAAKKKTEARPSQPSAPESAPAPSQPSSVPVPSQPPPGRPRGAATEPADADSHVVPVFFGTDRNAQPGAERVSFGTDRGKTLVLGRVLVTVPKSHQIPNVERPAVYRMPFTQIVLYREREDPAKHFTIKEMRALAEDEFLALVRDRLAGSSRFKDHAVVFVHGFNTTFEYAAFRTAQIAYDLKFDGAPFVYSWPSKSEVGAQPYAYDRESVTQAEPHFRRFLDLVTTRTGAKTISIIAHSMGNQLVLATLRDIKRSAPRGVEIAQVILAAPDVDRDSFEFLAREIQGVSRGVTLYAASNDRALDISRRFWGGVPRAGDVPAGGPLVVPGIDTIDVTATNTEMFSLHHSGYAEKTALLNDIQLLIQTGERPPERRVPILQRLKTAKGDYWRYPGAR